MRHVDKQDKLRMRELYASVEPLQRQRDSLAAELDSIETEYALLMRDTGTVEVLFRELDSTLFAEVYPLMRERGMTGVLGLSIAEYMGYAKRIDLNQYTRLLMDGWGTCLVFDKGYNFDMWYNTMLKFIQRDGLEMPTAVFFPNDTYDAAYEEKLIEYGFDTVIVNAPDGRSETVTPVDGAIWYTGSMPWNYTGMNSDTEILARTDGANMVYTVSFKNLWDAYEKESFVKVLDNWASMQEKDELLESLIEPTPVPQDPTMGLTPEDELKKPIIRVTTVSAARSAHMLSESNNRELEKELETRRAAISKQIEELDTKIRDLYNQWDQTGRDPITALFRGSADGEHE